MVGSTVDNLHQQQVSPYMPIKPRDKPERAIKRWTWRKPAHSQGAALQELEDEYGGYNSDTYETAPT
jgi:hypothetical protein